MKGQTESVTPSAGGLVPENSQATALVKAVNKLTPQLAAAMPKHIDAGRFARVVMTAIRQTPGLAKCTPQSFLTSVLTAAQWGLLPNDGLGRAYLIPYGATCQLIPGYKGLLDLARRSGEISTITAEAVHKRDDFDFALGDEAFIRHKPYVGEEDPGVTWIFYAIARLKDGGIQRCVMTRSQVERIRDASPSAKSSQSPWRSHFDEMAKKTVIRRMCKLLPQSPELARAVELDEQAETTGQQTAFDPEVIDAVYSLGDATAEAPASEEKPAEPPVGKADKEGRAKA